MSSKLKRKRQAQRLMRELQESNDARARTISSLRHTTNNLGAEREANKKLAAMNSEQRDNFLRELARYKFIDDLIAEAIEHLPPDQRAYIQGTTQYIQKGMPYLECLQMPDVMPTLHDANCAAEANNTAVQVLRQYAFRFLNDERTNRISLCYDGEKYTTYALPDFLADLSERRAMAFMRRELAPVFYRHYMAVHRQRKESEHAQF